MIIDAHSHICTKEMYDDDGTGINNPVIRDMMWPDRSKGSIPNMPWVGTDQVIGMPPEDLIKQMDESGVDMTVVLSADAWYLGHHLHIPIEYVSDAIKKYPNRFIGFAGIHPDLVARCAREVKILENAITKLGHTGLKLTPCYDNYYLNDERIFPLYEKCIELDIPVGSHIGWTTPPGALLKYCKPILFDEVAARYRDLKIILLEVGLPWTEEAICVAGRHKNVYLELSNFNWVYDEETILRYLLLAPKYGCTHDKIMWGTDALVHQGESLKKMREGLPKAAKKMGWPMISDRDMELILGESAARLFKINT